MSAKPIFFKLEFPKVDPKFPLPPQAAILARHDFTWHCLTPKITESELDGYIDDLIRELEQIRKEGKRKFAAADKELRG
jgi:hypothetical protein